MVFKNANTLPKYKIVHVWMMELLSWSLTRGFLALEQQRLPSATHLCCLWYSKIQ